MKKIALIVLIFAVVGGTAFALDLESFPDSIEEGNILISPTFNFGGLGYVALGGLMLSVTVSVDYALPIPIMVGGEAGVGFFTVDGGPFMIPILARASWHPNFEVDSLDVYLRIKLGYNIAFNNEWGGGFSGGGCAGARYFFTDNVGVFGEFGYDWYGLSLDLGWFGRYSTSAYTWFHAGVTFKIGD